MRETDNIGNTLEILVNLIYLARYSIDEPQKLIEYLDLAEIQVLELIEKTPAKDHHLTHEGRN